MSIERNEKKEVSVRVRCEFISEWNLMTISIEKREKKRTFSSICGLIQFGMESNDNLNREEREKTNSLSDSKFDFVQNGVKRQFRSRKERKTNSLFAFELKSDRNEIELQSRSRTERKKRIFSWIRASVQFGVNWKHSYRFRRGKEKNFLLNSNWIQLETNSHINLDREEREREFFVGVRTEFRSNCDRAMISIEKREEKRISHRFKVWLSSTWIQLNYGRTIISIEKTERRNFCATFSLIHFDVRSKINLNREAREKEIFARISIRFSSNWNRTTVSTKDEWKRHIFVEVDFNSIRNGIAHWFWSGTERERERERENGIFLSNLNPIQFKL